MSEGSAVAMTPTPTESSAPRPVLQAWSPPSRRAQYAGAIVILLVSAFWALVVPFVNGLVPSANPFVAGAPFDIGGATVEPAEGWQLKGGAAIAGLTTIEKGGASVIFTPAVSGATVDGVLATAAAGLRADTSGTAWQVGNAERFVTEAGAPGGRLVGTGPADVAVTYVVADDASSVTIVVRADQTSWKSLAPEIDAMARSVVLAAGPNPTEAP